MFRMPLMLDHVRGGGADQHDANGEEGTQTATEGWGMEPTGSNSARKYQTHYVQRGESTAVGRWTCEEDTSHNDAGAESPRNTKAASKKGARWKGHSIPREETLSRRACIHVHGIGILSRARQGRENTLTLPPPLPLPPPPRQNNLPYTTKYLPVFMALAHHVLWLGPREVLVPHVRLVQPVQVPRVGRLGLRAHAVQAAGAKNKSTNKRNDRKDRIPPPPSTHVHARRTEPS